MEMQDLYQLYNTHGMKKTFLNFFKTTYYRDARQFLLDEGMPPDKILQRSRPYRGHASTCMAHDLIAFAFVQWDDGKKFNRMLQKIIA